MISLKEIYYKYPGATEPIIKNLSLDIDAGETLTLMGANGSGKSTLARLLAGLLKPESGEINISNRQNHQAGFLFQNPDSQMIAMTVAKEVAFALENRAIPEAQMQLKIDRMLNLLGIANLKDRLTNELSGGEKQRVALAASIVCLPDLLILDEPDSYLDADGRLKLKELLSNLKEDQPQLIIVRVTQYLAVARASERLILLDQGEVIADGNPNDILGDQELCRQAGLAYLEAEHGCGELNRQGKLKQTIQSISLSKIAFGYEQSLPVLQDVDFQVTKGETLFLFGPTGCGKSSLGMILSGLVEPTIGEIDILSPTGETLSKLTPGLVSAVFQSPDKQFFLESCADEIAWGPNNFGRPIASKQIANYLDLVGLDPDKFSDRDPLSLSVGEKRRLAFAVVLAISPEFIIFDEPTASLDPAGVGWFISLSKQLKQLGVGQLIISHERTLGLALADRAYCLLPDKSAKEFSSWAEVMASETLNYLAE